MATFFSNQTVWYWGNPAYQIKGTLTGNVTRSGNTVTLSGMNLALNWSSVPAGFGYDADVSFTVNGTPTSRRIAAYTTTSYALNNTSLTVGSTATSANISWSSSDNYSGSFTITFPSGSTKPSGLSVKYNSCTWNSISITSSVTSWGTGYTGTPNLEQIVIQSSATGSNWTSTGRSVKQNATSSLSSTQSVSNTNKTFDLSGGINIRGCTSFKVGAWASTSAGDGGSNAFDNTVRYTPPAPLQTLSKASESYAGNNKSNVTVSVTGGNSTNNNNVSVSTQYRYSTNGGSSWTAWAQAGTGTPWTAKTATFQVPCNTSIKVEARQVYQSQASEVKSLTFTSMKTPARLYVPVSSKSKLARKAYIGINGQSEKVLKIYKGVNGQSKLVYTA